MLWTDTRQYPHNFGSLYLGRDRGRKVGIKTERHAITIAGAGAGKGATVIIPNLLYWPHNALVIDPKGEAAEATAEAREKMGQVVFVVDPFSSSNVDERFRATYNPLDEIDPDALTVREDIETIADGIIMRPDARSAHWDDGAQSLISGLIAYVITADDCEGKRNLIEVRKILMDGDRLADTMEKMRTMDECAGLCREGYSAAFAKEGGYFVSNAQKNTKWLDSRGMAEALASSSFKLSDLKRDCASVFLVLPANYLGQHGRFLRLFVRCGIEAMARKLPTGELRGRQCLFILDEFFSLGYIDEIAKAAGLMRGYGLQLWPILQDLGQLITLYGREGAETFFANADVHQFFGNTDQLTLDQISVRAGVVDMSEVEAPPPPPKQRASLVGAGLSLMAGNHVLTRSTIGVAGQAMTLTKQNAHARKEAEYRDQMNLYQRRVAEHGRSRLPTDQVAAIVQKKRDVVADNMICFLFGREAVKLQPDPYFRKRDLRSWWSDYRTEKKPEKERTMADDVTSLFWVGAWISFIYWASL